MSKYIRSGQWKLMLLTYDRWGAFCKAAELYEDKMRTASSK